MDEQTENLRDIFVDVADGATVTDEQSTDRGTLSDRGTVRERIADVVAAMRDRYAFETDMADDTLARLVRGFYEGESDAALADALDTSVATIRTARFDLHLVRDGDTEAQAGAGVDAAAEGGTDDRPERAGRALAAEAAARRASRRYRSQFEELLVAAGFDVRLTAATREDGLREAAADSETDMDL